ncbi:MAG: enoyl-CoA hydratase [Ramlibacter sp.]|nr:enoyl-CoA hydratase [Ramlibacter sp.]
MAERVAPAVRTEVRGHVGVVTMAHLESRKPLNLRLEQDLVEQLQVLERDPAVFAVVLAGTDGHFMTGTTDRVFQVVRQFAKPVIAAVEGHALGGGCALALACDIVIAAEDARFGQPEIRAGILPGASGTQRLLQAAGRYKTLLWCLTGDTIPASDAYLANLVSELVPPGQAQERAIELAEQIGGMPPLAVQGIREAVRLAAG